MMKSAFIAVVGRPSVGKSTLVNALCHQKVSIVSAVPQTTRNAIRGILTTTEGQLVFVDTPGFHDSDKKMNKRLRQVVDGTLQDADLVLYLIDVSRPLGPEERTLAANLAEVTVPVVVVINKIDLGSVSEELRQFGANHLPKATWIEVSALTNTGVDKLSALLLSLAPEGQEWYPSDYYTDQEPDFRITEIIREEVMNRTREELPHAVYVGIEDLELRWDPDLAVADRPPIPDLWDWPLTERPKLWIRAFIGVERDSQKGILIGAGGQMIKAIRLAAENQLRGIFPYRIALDLQVKVQSKWRNDDRLLNKLIGL